MTGYKVTRRQGDETSRLRVSPCHPVTLSPCQLRPRIEALRTPHETRNRGSPREFSILHPLELDERRACFGFAFDGGGAVGLGGLLAVEIETPEQRVAVERVDSF